MEPSSICLAAACYNACLLIFNVGFTRYKQIAQLDPSLFSKDGQISVLLWGLAYLATGPRGRRGDAIFAVFAIEKLFYVIRWIQFHRKRKIVPLLRKAFGKLDILAPTFFACYGVGDFAFGVAFLMLWLA